MRWKPVEMTLSLVSAEIETFLLIRYELDEMGGNLLKRCIKKGNLHGVKFLLDECLDQYRDDVFSYAAKEGQLEIIQYLMASLWRPEDCWYASAINLASEYGHPAVAKWLTENR